MAGSAFKPGIAVRFGFYSAIGAGVGTSVPIVIVNSGDGSVHTLKPVEQLIVESVSMEDTQGNGLYFIDAPAGSTTAAITSQSLLLASDFTLTGEPSGQTFHSDGEGMACTVGQVPSVASLLMASLGSVAGSLSGTGRIVQRTILGQALSFQDNAVDKTGQAPGN